MAQKNSEGAKQNTLYSVTLRGQVKSIERRDVTDSSVTIVVKLKLEVRNDGAKSVIFPDDDPPQMSAAILTRNPSDPFTNALVVDHWGASIDRSPRWATLRGNLDKTSPPRDKVRILKPHESWEILE